MKKLHSLFFLFIIVWTPLVAQSDEPCMATLLPVASSCSTISYINGAINPPAFTNSTSASAGVTLPALTCNGFTTTTRDFWFKVTVPASGKVVVTIQAGEGTSPTGYWDMAIYRASSPTCTGSTFTQIGSSCEATAPPSISITGETAGSTLYIRVWREASRIQTDLRTYEIYAVDGNASPITTCGTYITPSSGATGEVELRFIFDKPANTFSYDFYIGTSVASAVNIGSVDANITTTRDTIDTPYAYLNGTSMTNIVSPNAGHVWYIVPQNCAGVSPPVSTCQASASSFTTGSEPTNQNCSGALQLAPDVVYYAPTTFATQSQAAALCSGYTSEHAADTWFKFRTNATGGSAVVTVQSYGLSNVIVQAFSGACGSLTALSCADDAFEDDFEEITLNGLAANTTYYIRVFTYVEDGYFFWPDGFDIDITGTGVIPVELVKFTGEQRGMANVLKWTTAAEKDAQDFVVERSETGDATSFKALGVIKSAGTSNVLRDYEMIDPAPTAVSYYRLRQRDLNGNESFSKTILLQRTDKKLLINKVFPSPTSGDLSIQFNNPRNGTVQFELVDILGRVVLQKTAAYTEGGQLERLSLQNVPVGTYVLRLTNGVTATQTRIVKN